MRCIEELHEQLGQPVLDALAVMAVKPAQLKELQARLGYLQASAQAVQEYPLFQPVAHLLTRQCSGNSSSRSDCSNQVLRQKLALVSPWCSIAGCSSCKQMRAASSVLKKCFCHQMTGCGALCRQHCLP